MIGPPINRILQSGWLPWVGLIVTIIVCCQFTSVISEPLEYLRGFFDGLFTDSTKGWNYGVKEAAAKPGKTHISFIQAYSFQGILMGIFALCLLGLLIYLLALVHYGLLFKPLWQRNKLAYSALYVVWLYIFWRFLAFMFNSCKPGFSTESLSYSLFSIVLVLGFAIYRTNQETVQRESQLLQQKTQAELDSLKAQVNPHFLFNSLNNIYGTALGEDSPRTAESIRQLADIVRYVMEESRKNTTDVGRELRFLDDYVELHRMRIPRQDNITIKIETHWDEVPAQILPLLLNPLIENAFKYGISMQHPCFVNIRLFIEKGILTFTAENSIVPRKTLEKGTGLGLDNVRKRLALAYPGRHTFETGPTDNETFKVNLKILL